MTRSCAGEFLAVTMARRTGGFLNCFEFCKTASVFRNLANGPSRSGLFAFLASCFWKDFKPFCL